MVAVRMSRRGRRYSKQILRVNSKQELQTIASNVQTDMDKKNLSYDEALGLGNLIQSRSDQLPGDAIIYGLSDRDTYRKSLELYLRDSLLTQAEQMLLWEERRRLGITDTEHENLLNLLLNQWKGQGKKVTIDRFDTPGGAEFA